MGAQSDVTMKFKQIGIVGAGNIGSMMGFAFSELGLDVSTWCQERECRQFHEAG